MLDDLKPRHKHLVFDLVEEAGFDTTDWIESFNSSKGYKANPKYCYEWAYLQPDLVILNLWHPNMVEENGQIMHRANFRSDADFHRRISGKQQWAARAQRLDEAVQTAHQNNLPVRVIVLAGVMREKEKLDGVPSSVRFRELDPEPWTVTAYDRDTGAFELMRGVLDRRYADQFDLGLTDEREPERREITASPFVRDPAVRRRVLARASGSCELCGESGFRMASGALYLETHHIIPLADGGLDHEKNVVALCANDHRRAHFAEEKVELAERLIEIVAAMPTAATRASI